MPCLQLRCLNHSAGAEVGVPGRESSAAGTKLQLQAERSPVPRTEALQPRPTPRFLKGSGVPRTQQPREHQGAPRFLKGGKHLRHSQLAPPIEEEDLIEEDDACEDELQSAEILGRPRRRRSRMRRHECGYNKAAQLKALECTVLSAGMLSPLLVTCAPL